MRLNHGPRLDDESPPRLVRLPVGGMSERVIFLDADGVLNHVGLFRNTRTAFPLSREACERFAKVCEIVGARAVLSSSWRGFVQGERRLREFGALRYWHPDRRTRRNLIERTYGRGDEIAEWLSRHPEVTEYAIVDDDDDMRPEQMTRFVQTDFANGGLLQEHADRLIMLFPSPPQESGNREET